MYIIIYDFGTSSVKTCLFEIDSAIRLVVSSTAAYDLFISDDGGAEQDTEEWWTALCSTTRELFQKTERKCCFRRCSGLRNNIENNILIFDMIQHLADICA